ncbi:anillin isoform X2 [Plodia interpunctella]|uniref:anillin isoform X2 n=1 Tax=Plodia interpunctella TaxID=58824 RepID=UPI00236839F2|nr:anillin isoform X2 [Plodia interpunctella]
MDPFTQRMLERARARQEKIDQKLASSGQTVPKRKPLAENILNKNSSPSKSPPKIVKESIVSPNSISAHKDQIILSTPQKSRNDVVVTKREFKSLKSSVNRRNSDVSVEINISHRNDIQIEVQVEERDAPISITYDPECLGGSNVVIKEIDNDASKAILDKADGEHEMKTDRAGLRTNMKSRLDRLGNLYSDKPNLSSPIHRTEQQFRSETPPTDVKEMKVDGKRKFGRLAALADQINNWEDDLTHHTFNQEPPKKQSERAYGAKADCKHSKEKLDASTLDVSIHSIRDINQALQGTTTKAKQPTSKTHSNTYIKSSNECQRLKKEIVAELEPKCALATPSATAAPNMATLVANSPPVNPVTKKPSIKKYRAPTPPSKQDDFDSDKDKENNIVEKEENDNASDCVQTKPEVPDKPVIASPLKKLAPKLNGNVDRNSVLSRAAMFEAGSPRAKDPAEMSLRERKALFEKNKGAAIVPKAPFGMAPSVKTLHGDKEPPKPIKPVQTSTKSTPTKSSNTSSNSSRTNSKETVAEDNISQSSVGGGIKDKLAALFNKEQTISESTITNKFKQEREKEMEMLQSRFHYKPKQHKPDDHPSESDDDQDHDPSEKVPLMGSTTSLSLASKKPEIIANIPKVHEGHRDVRHEDDKVIGAQPVKRRSSQSHDSPIVLSVLDDVKRIKVNNNKKESNTNGAVLQQPTSLYPHLSDIETDTSHTQEEYSDCGGSSEENENDKLNKSDNWAETSFGREVMNVVKKNNTSYKKAVRESNSDSSQSACDSELDEMLDEALDDSEGPTPPKVNKNGSLSSTSFVYKEKSQFKSPIKPQPATPARDRGAELVHSVSFYRRMQASTTPSTPMRQIRHQSPERDIPPTPEPAAQVTTVRQRIKELQAEIAKQQTIISQASQALNLCAATIEFSGSTEQAEGERLLLLASHRRQACVQEVQRLQVEGAGPASAPGTASLRIASLSAPLRRDYVRQLNADGAVGHHAVCLVKCRDRVLATSMQLTQPASALLRFPDEILMDGLTSDFKVTVEIYLLQASKEILPHEVKYHITNKKSSSKLLTPRSKVSELKVARVQSPGGPLAVRSTHFSLHGYCIFALQHASRKSFTLSKVPCGSPLEGSVQLSMSGRRLLPAPAPHAAFLTAFDDVSGLGAWHRRWLRLQPPLLSYWKYPDDVNKKLPIGDIDLTTVTSEKATRAPRDLCARPNTILLETSVPAGLIVPEHGSLVYCKREDGTVVRRHLLAADTPKDRDVWLDCINQALEYVRCSVPDEN